MIDPRSDEYKFPDGDEKHEASPGNPIDPVNQFGAEDLEGCVTAGCWEDTPTIWDRIRWRLFPSKHCRRPESDFESRDCVRSTSVTKLGFIDRIRCLITGIVIVTIRVDTEFEVGKTATNSTCHIGTSKDWS